MIRNGNRLTVIKGRHYKSGIDLQAALDALKVQYKVVKSDLDWPAIVLHVRPGTNKVYKKERYSGVVFLD